MINLKFHLIFIKRKFKNKKMKKIRIIFLVIIFAFIFLLYYHIFLQKIEYDKKEIFQNFKNYQSELTEIAFSNDHQNSFDKNKNNLINDYSTIKNDYNTIKLEKEIQSFIYSKFKDKNLYLLDEESGFLNKNIANIVQFDNNPSFLIVDKNNKIIKKYEFKKDFNLKVNEYSIPISINKKAITFIDPTTFEPKQGDLILISSAYYNEKYDNFFYDSKVSAIITDAPEDIVESDLNLFFTYKENKKKDGPIDSNYGFIKIIVKPSIFSELANYTYNGYKIKIESSWEIKELELIENLTLIPGKIKNELFIIQVPIIKENRSLNFNSLATILAFLDLLSENQKKTIRSVIFFFSNRYSIDFSSELNFISSFKTYPKNTSALILEDLPLNELNLYTFKTDKNQDRINRFIKEITFNLRKYDIKYTVDYQDTNHLQFPYIFSKIPAISIDSSSISRYENNLLNEKDFISYFNLIYEIATKIPLIYKIFFYMLLFIFFALLLIFLAANDKIDDKVNS